MTPRKKRTRTRHQRRYGTWFTVGQVLVILGAVLIIIAAIIDIVYFIAGTNTDVWQSYTFGWLGVPFLGAAIAIVMAILILWLAVDRRIYYRLDLILYAILLIVLAILAGNIGALIIIIGALIIIFYKFSRS